MFRSARIPIVWTVLSALLIATAVLAGLNGIGQGNIDKMVSALYESNPNVMDSGGGKATSTSYMTVASIGQPLIGLSTSSLYKNEAGFLTTDVAVEEDNDGDGVPDEEDNCPSISNPDQSNSDGDDVGNACDNCWAVANAGQTDSDADCPSPPYTSDPLCGDACAECLRGDVNCDVNVTPGDALCAFWRAILGSFQTECLCDCSAQAAEVNCDGNITPGDALCIFWRAILGDWTDECECSMAKTVTATPRVDRILISSAEARPGEQVKVTILIENPREFDAFAMVFSYPADLLQFDRISSTPWTRDWTALEGRLTDEGSLTIGGFNTEGITSSETATLVEISFTIREDVSGRGEFELIDLTDDLVGAQVSKGNITVRALPISFALAQNYPNPFNPTTTITYTIPVQSMKSKVEGEGSLNFEPYTLYVTLKVFNVMGQEVATLVDEVKEPGFCTVTWDASQMASGVYFYRLVAGEFSQTRRMVLMK